MDYYRNRSGIRPIIVLCKIDLIEEHRTAEIVENIKARIKNVPILCVSNESKDGFDQLNAMIEKGKTYCMLGSSGVGKSTLINSVYKKTQCLIRKRQI